MSEKLLRMCVDLGLIDSYEVDGEQVWIRQGMRYRAYTARAAQQMIDEMLVHSPMLRKIVERC